MRQFINHLDHFVWVCKTENLERYVQQFSDLFGAKFDGPFERENWFRVYVSWDTGFEISAPLTEDSRGGQHLKKHGEGPYAMVFGVEDLEAAKSHARELGYDPSEDILQTGEEPWTYRLESIVEAYVGEVLNTTMLFRHVVRKEGVVTTR